MNTILAILFIHWLADFIFQNRKMGLNKGKSIKWLTFHVMVYTIVTGFCWVIFSPELVAIKWLLIITFTTHWITDFITSKASGFCYLMMNEAKFLKDDYDAHLGMKNRYDDEIRAQLIVKRDHQEEREHGWQYWFWAVIGIDQFIHIATLLITYEYLIKPISI